MDIFKNDVDYCRVSTEQYRNLPRLRRDIRAQLKRLQQALDVDAENLHPGLSVFHAQGIEVKEHRIDDLFRIITFAPHDFPRLHYLNLTESHFVRSEAPRDEWGMKEYPDYYREELYSEFEKTCARKVAEELLARINDSPHQISRLMKNFLSYARSSRCIRRDENKYIAKFCLEVLQQQVWSDETLIVEILKLFFSSPWEKQDFITDDYTYIYLKYIFTNCAGAKFNIRQYLTHDDRGDLIYFCPVTACIIFGDRNFRKLKALLEHGFELQVFDTEMCYYTSLMMVMYSRLGSVSYQVDLRDRRTCLLMKFFYMVCRMYEDNQEIWADCAKILFNSVPEPYVSHSELFCFLNKIYRNKPLFDAFSMCKEHFSSCYVSSPLPRKLKHLSRCVIRRVLRDNFQLPHGIDALPLPRILIRYLKSLED